MNRSNDSVQCILGFKRYEYALKCSSIIAMSYAFWL